MGNNILTAVFLLSVCSVGGLSEQSPAYTTLEGQTALLPCTFTFTSIERLTIEWTKNDKDLSPNYVFTLRSGHEDYDMKNPKFRYRTQLFMDEVSNGNASLRISDVSLSDAGKYKCKTFQDSGQNEREVELFVGSALEPKFLEVSIEAEGVSLRCEASCWFPETQMTFLDEQGKVINTENSTPEPREGTGCFTVTGRITAKSAGRFICRVHQPDMNLTRDAEIYVWTESRAEHVTSSSSCSIYVAVTILVSVVVIIYIVFRRKLSKLFKCVFRRRRKSLQPHSDQDIERQKYDNGASTCEDDNIENSNREQTNGPNGPDQNQTSVSLSREDSYGSVIMGNNILTAVFLSSVCSVGGLSEQSPVSRTVALEGQTALLPCTFTFTNIEHLTIEWTKNDEKDLSPNYVFTFRSSHEDYHMKNLKFQHRTHLFMDEVSKGNASLRISDVSLSDTGKYKCKIIQDSGQNEREVELFVGSASEPKFLEFSIEADGVSLRCEASCWFPEPQMTFLDEQGKVINTEKSMTEQREGTGCFTVTGRITAQSAGRFICRVHQPNMNLIRDAEIYVPTQSRAEHLTYILVAMGVVILLLVVVIFCIVFRGKLSKLSKRVCMRGQKHSHPDIEGQNSENERSEEMSRLTGDQNQTSVSDQGLSRSASVVSNSSDGPANPPVQENCSRTEPLNVLLSPKSTEPPDLQKTEPRIQRQHSAPAQLFSTSVKRRTRLTSHDSTPETSPLMEDFEH
ncbi:uncharacterized protein V6R79_006423 [Siganus canaliculatus]